MKNTTSFYHTPVLLSQAVAGLQVTKNKWYVDATLGGGGYTAEILKFGGYVLGIDADTDAVAWTRKRLKKEFPKFTEGKEWILKHNNFRNLEHIVKTQEVGSISGVVFDLGVSSFQLDSPQKGMSFRFDEGPFDLRLDQESGIPAWLVIKQSSKEAIYEILATFGEEKHAVSIANVLFSASRVKDLQTVEDVKQVVAPVVAKEEQTDTLARLFQAFRIYVNDELEALHEGLLGAQHVLHKKGRLAVVSFHSLEDRTVKLFMRKNGWNILTKKPIVAGEEELEKNRRSRSAKLRISEKI